MDMVDNAAAIDRIIESCRALCLDVRWHDVYTLATSVELEEVNPALLRMKVTAACALNDKTLLAALAPEIIDLPDGHPLFYPLVGQIQRSGHGDIGADMLLGRANAAADPRYAVFLRRAISLNRGDEGRTATLEAALNAATNGGWDMKGEPSSHHFPAPLPALMGPPVQIVPAPGLDRRHIDRLTGDTAKFLARMQKPAPGYIVEYANVVVDRHGQIWTPDGKVIVSLGKPIDFNEAGAGGHVAVATSVVAHTKGIYHFMVNHLPRLAFLFQQGADPDVKLLTNAGGKAFERALLDLAGFGPDRLVAVDKPVFVERLLKVVCGFEGMTGWSHMVPMFQTIVNAALAEAARHQVELPPRIYISRAAAARRSMRNEEALEQALAARGVRIYRFEDIPLWHQIALVNSARVIVAPHGAGLAHMLMASADVKIIELLPIAMGTYLLRWNYARLAILRGFEYRAWVEEQFLAVQDDWSITLDEFLAYYDGLALD